MQKYKYYSKETIFPKNKNQGTVPSLDPLIFSLSNDKSRHRSPRLFVIVVGHPSKLRPVSHIPVLTKAWGYTVAKIMFFGIRRALVLGFRV